MFSLYKVRHRDMLFFSSEFKHKIKLKLVRLNIYWIVGPIYNFFWEKIWVKADTNDLSTSPKVVAEIVKEIIKGKRVCELGCRKGFLLLEFAKYAREVVGVEKDKNFSELCRRKGLHVINGDIFEIPIPDADVYYFWLNAQQTREIMRRLREQGKRGTVIRGFMHWEDKIFDDWVISCPRRWGGATDFKIQIITI